MTLSNTVFERARPFLLVAIIPLVVASILIDLGVETQPEYTAGSIARLLPEREQFVTGVGLILAAALAALGAGGLLFLRLRSLGLPLVTPSTLGMLVACLLILGAADVGLRISQLETQSLSVGGPAADQLGRSAVSLGQFRFMLSGLRFVLVLVSPISCGFAIHRLTVLPHWLSRLSVASAVIVVASPLGFVAFGLFAFLAVSTLAPFSWLTLEAGWLLVRGTAITRACPATTPRNGRRSVCR